ncbi:hypothetical protein J2129_000364 [Methanofollis sp. W23]|nr:hypothetical protein [Methanofollis sp. W23]MBP2144910.1 hypothetical protein [Methanofollis sp. W23]
MARHPPTQADEAEDRPPQDLQMSDVIILALEKHMNRKYTAEN